LSINNTVSIVTMLQAKQTRGRVPTAAKGLSLFQNVQTGSGPNPVSYSVGVAVLSPAMNHLETEVDHWSPCSAEVKNEWSSTFTTPVCLHDVGTDNFTVTNS